MVTTTTARTSADLGPHRRRGHTRHVSYTHRVHDLGIDLEKLAASQSPIIHSDCESTASFVDKGCAEPRRRALNELSSIQESLTALARRNNHVVDVDTEFSAEEAETLLVHIRRVSGVSEEDMDISSISSIYGDTDDSSSRFTSNELDLDTDDGPGSPNSSTTCVEEDTLASWSSLKLGSPAALKVPDIESESEHFTLKSGNQFLEGLGLTKSQTNPAIRTEETIQLRSALALLLFDLKLTLRILISYCEVPGSVPMWCLPLSAVIVSSFIAYFCGMVV